MIWNYNKSSLSTKHTTFIIYLNILLVLHLRS